MSIFSSYAVYFTYLNIPNLVLKKYLVNKINQQKEKE